MTTPQSRILLIVLAIATVPMGVFAMYLGNWLLAVIAWVSGIYISSLARQND